MRVGIITLNIAYLWHFFLDQISFGSTFWSLPPSWRESSWIMVLAEDRRTLTLGFTLYLWCFLRLSKKVKDNQRPVVNSWLQEWVSCRMSITMSIFSTSGSYLTFPNWKSINGFYSVLSVCIFGCVWINILSKRSCPTIFGSKIFSTGDEWRGYSGTLSFSSAWIHQRAPASSDLHQAWKQFIFKRWEK